MPANRYIITSTAAILNILAKFQYHISGGGLEAGGFDQRGDREMYDMSNGVTSSLLCPGDYSRDWATSRHWRLLPSGSLFPLCDCRALSPHKAMQASPAVL